MYKCEVCRKETLSVSRDKVNNKLACGSCRVFAIKNGIRFDSDFEKVKNEESVKLQNLLVEVEHYISQRGLTYSDSIETLVDTISED